MINWHETRIANVALRGGGAGLLGIGWAAGALAYERIHAHPPGAASLGELGLCALMVVGVLAGAALLMVGPGLWKQVEVPGRRGFQLAEPTQTPAPGYAPGTNDNGPTHREARVNVA